MKNCKDEELMVYRTTGFSPYLGGENPVFFDFAFGFSKIHHGNAIFFERIASLCKNRYLCFPNMANGFYACWPEKTILDYYSQFVFR
jgi:hypothetical protein